MAESTEVFEGFICPICMTDLKSPNNLTKHFEEYHNDDPEILKSLKGLIGKAKKKILKQDEMQASFLTPVSESKPKCPEIDWGPQEIGFIRSHTQYFREVRNIRLERYMSETNKLLIRLDKLLNNLPSDPIDRKAHERTIVPWIDEKDVNLCPSCAKSFHVARRKHHCRLCGSIMCHSCTAFLSLVDARKMTSPVAVQDDSVVTQGAEGPVSKRLVRAGIGLTKLVRSPSSGSLNSVLSLVNDPSSGEQNFRLCNHCMNLLEARERLKARQFDKPIVCQFYDKLYAYMTQAMQHVEMYNKMSESLSQGETTYNLEDAQMLREKIAKLGESIDIISKKISFLIPKNEESSVQSDEYQLYQTIRLTAMRFIREKLLSAQALPTEQEYIALQEKREKQIEAMIQYERQLEEEQREKRRDQFKKEPKASENGSPNKKTQPQIVLDQSQGWGPSSITPITSSSMDPIIEQMRNLRAYIKQARTECKYDEVATLESNLKELQSAYFTMKENSNDS
ncbi:rabenosyn-5 [Prorops nasuta]|uniref:rabenosyn-5 n=1 Tax=Prorops nasuta TaxID=863751 RepID=UPI0034CF7E98